MFFPFFSSTLTHSVIHIFLRHQSVTYMFISTLLFISFSIHYYYYLLRNKPSSQQGGHYPQYVCAPTFKKISKVDVWIKYHLTPGHTTLEQISKFILLGLATNNGNLNKNRFCLTFICASSCVVWEIFKIHPSNIIVTIFIILNLCTSNSSSQQIEVCGHHSGCLAWKAIIESHKMNLHSNDYSSHHQKILPLHEDPLKIINLVRKSKPLNLPWWLLRKNIFQKLIFALKNVVGMRLKFSRKIEASKPTFSFFFSSKIWKFFLEMSFFLLANTQHSGQQWITKLHKLTENLSICTIGAKHEFSSGYIKAKFQYNFLSISNPPPQYPHKIAEVYYFGTKATHLPPLTKYRSSQKDWVMGHTWTLPFFCMTFSFSWSYLDVGGHGPSKMGGSGNALLRQEAMHVTTAGVIMEPEHKISDWTIGKTLSEHLKKTPLGYVKNNLSYSVSGQATELNQFSSLISPIIRCVLIGPGASNTELSGIEDQSDRVRHLSFSIPLLGTKLIPRTPGLSNILSMKNNEGLFSLINQKIGVLKHFLTFDATIQSFDSHMIIKPCGPPFTSGSSHYDSRFTDKSKFDHIYKLFTTLHLKKKT
ncbi:hypothetical protein VP01_3482g2 [Puccinia sorghi]|uniref:Uncharacterized protein n=1 Tax=Puccinia sorghi TaxID=27349 RepID=A0A0L6UVX6_9BASI|nr:hypothetical protein VP01_3482g2 [Puccinia sorghi]